MSTLSTINVKHPSSASNNIVLDSSGNVTVANNATITGTLTAASVVGVQTITATTGSAPYYGARAWVNFIGTGTVAIRASANVTSITDNDVGLYTVNINTAMPDVNYAAVVTISTSSSSNTANPGNYGFDAVNLSTSTCRIGTALGLTDRDDMGVVNVAIFR